MNKEDNKLNKWLDKKFSNIEIITILFKYSKVIKDKL